MHELIGFLEAHSDVVCVTLAGVQGSVPREEGAFMLVSNVAQLGTIGGGQLEYMAMDEARRLLACPDGQSRQMDVPLGPEIGQCCGGRVVLELEQMDAVDKRNLLKAERARIAAQPEVIVYGAGHVGRALARAFAPLPVALKLVDSRPEEIVLAPEGVETFLTPLPETVVRTARAGAAHIVATHEHALDFLLAQEALARGDAAYVGMIGSKSKRAQFINWAEGDVSALICPMAAASKGGGKNGRRPEVIAAFVTAEVMAVLQAYYADVKTSAVKEIR